ncbi:MAG: hypothetical protein KGK34_07230 [Chloroflexota bacterium]|nr:hypothetical protein [Chloroflexota bacterium]
MPDGFTFLGQKGIRAWLAAAGAGAGGIIIATKILPAIGGGGSSSSGGGSSTDAAVTAISKLAQGLAASQGAVVQSAMGPGASLGQAGIDVAGQATNALGGVVISQSQALSDVAQRSLDVVAQQASGILDAFSRIAAKVAAPTPAPPPPAAAPAPAPASGANLGGAGGSPSPAPVAAAAPPASQVKLAPAPVYSPRVGWTVSGVPAISPIADRG